jgi:molecular chaperone GrpE (heat shock protein)
MRGLVGVNLKDVERKTSEGASAAAELWMALKKEVDRKQATLDATPASLDIDLGPCTTQAAGEPDVSGGNGLAMLDVLIAGGQMEFRDVMGLIEKPIDTALKPMLEAIQARAIKLLPPSESLKPAALLDLLEFRSSMRQMAVRVENENEQLLKNIKRLLTLLIPQFNSIESLRSTFDEIAVKCEQGGQDEPSIAFATSLTMTYKEMHQRFQESLPDFGLECIRPVIGSLVDWSMHHPSDTKEVDSGQEGAIAEVVQPGYRMILTGEMLQMADVVINRVVSQGKITAKEPASNSETGGKTARSDHPTGTDGKTERFQTGVPSAEKPTNGLETASEADPLPAQAQKSEPAEKKASKADQPKSLNGDPS